VGNVGHGPAVQGKRTKRPAVTPPASTFFLRCAPAAGGGYARRVTGVNSLAVGFLAVALGILLGAFGAHGLGDVGAQRLGFWQTATLYHFIAGFGLVALGLVQQLRPTSGWPAIALVLGILLFSGSLYVMGLGGPRWLGAVTPLGGTALIVGFLGLGLQALKQRPAARSAVATDPR
jgi:uncharacterized membrane protein YgdD (TMEM256/DUF423 family)